LESRLAAQQVPVTTIRSTDREASLAQGFTRIVAIRELQDGRLVLLDADDRLVYIVSATLTEARQIGRTGDGPGEYRMPSRLLPLGADTTAVLDTHNGRLLTITASAEPGRILDLRFSNGRSTSQPPSASDLTNRFYARARPVRTSPDGTLEVADSVAILRWTLNGQPDTAAFIADDPERYQLRGGLVRSSPITPFEPRPSWTVGADGRIAVVYPDPYHVMLIAPNRNSTEGPALPHEPIRVTEEHKQVHRAEAERPRPTMGGRINDPQSAAITMISWPFREPSEWAEFLPPFLVNAVIQFDPDGNLWVERTTPSPSDSRYDIIGRDGSLRHVVHLPAGTRLLGFGPRSLYVVRRDDVDLEYLDRYARPTISQ
jgi:hypothetical protein